MDFDEIIDIIDAIVYLTFIGIYAITMIIASPIILIGFIINFILCKFGVEF